MEDKLFKNLNTLINLRNTWSNLLSNKQNLATNIWNLVEYVKPVKDEVAKKLIDKLNDFMDEVEKEATIIIKQIQENN